MTSLLRTRAAFLVRGRWQWHTWTHSHASKHAAIVEKARELGAAGWDFGNADHGFLGEVNFGCDQHRDDDGAVVARLWKFYADCINDGVPAHTREPLWQWRAKFTLAHASDKGFKGGFFQLFDGKYDRSCLNLDYTPETKDEVIERFLEWCDPYYVKHSVKIDKKVVRVLAPEKETNP